MTRTSSSAISGRARAALWLAALLGVLVAASPGARAQADEARRRADDLARAGFAAYDRHDYERAIVAFEKAYQLAPAPGLLYDIAQAHRQRGPAGCVQALDWYRRYRAAAGAQGQVPPDVVAARIAEMERCVREHPAADRSASVAPTAPGPAPGPVPAAAAPAAPRRSSGRGRHRILGWWTLGFGAAALAGAAVTGAAALTREHRLEDRCPGDVCPADLRDDVRVYDRLRVTAIVSGVVGVAAIGAGLALLATGSSRESSASASMKGEKVRPWVGAASLGVQGSF
jgi:hypothetical protein